MKDAAIFVLTVYGVWATALLWRTWRQLERLHEEVLRATFDQMISRALSPVGLEDLQPPRPPPPN